MADIRINALPTLGDVAASDILHILDASTTDDVDKQTTVDAVADWIIANKNVRISGISDVPGLQAALDLKSNVGHTHIISEVTGLQTALDAKTDVTQAQIIGRNVILNGKSINVPSTIGGLQDDRIPDTVVVGEYLQFGTTTGGINNITGDDLKGDLALNLVDNTSDATKPVSGPQLAALDLKLDTVTYTAGQDAQDTRILENTNSIAATALDILLNTQKRSYPLADETKLAGIEAGADVTDTTNVWSSLGISESGSTGQFLTQRGVFVDTPEAVITKSNVDNAIGAGTSGTDYYSSNKTWLPIPTGGGAGTVTKAVIDAAIGASPTGNSGQFYNEQGNFIDVNYDTVENAPIIRNATVETITISGTRTNVQVPASGQSEMSTITMLDSFNPVPTQYTTTFTSPNTTLTPALVLPTGSQGRQLSLTELDGTVHRFCYLVNGNYRLLDGGLSGTVRLGAVAVATTATVTAAVTVPDQTADQTITLVGDETGTFSVGDFISPQANNFGAYRGIFIDSITFDGTNTVIVGPSNGATTFNTTSVLRNAGPADTIQGTFSNYSYDPDTTDTVYSNAVVNNPWSAAGADIETHITRVANSIVALDSGITWDGIITSTTLGGEPASSVTINLGTESNIDSSFTITGGINNMETVVNTDGAPGMGLTVSTTVQVIDPEGTEVASQTFGVSATTDNNVDAVGNFINDAVNNNTETPIDFDSEYGSGVLTLTAEEAGNTNPWTIVINNNGATTENAGNLSTSSVQTGLTLNQLDTFVIRSITDSSNRINFFGSDTLFQSAGNIWLNHQPNFSASGQSFTFLESDHTQIDVTGSFSVGDFSSQNDSLYNATFTRGNEFNSGNLDLDFSIGKNNSGDAINYDAGTDTLTFDATTINGLPSGSGDAVLAANQTFTGQNTFSNSVGIISNRVTGRNNTDTYVDISETSNGAVILYGNGVGVFSASEDFVVSNTFRNDIDFIVRKETSGDAINYNAGTDTLTFDVGTINGLPGVTPVTKAQVDTAIGASTGGDASLFYNQQGAYVAAGGGGSTDSGTWTPVFDNLPLFFSSTYRYERSGNIVFVSGVSLLSANTSTDQVGIDGASLPFPIRTSTLTDGQWGLFNGTYGFVYGLATSIVFFKNDGTDLIGTDIGSSPSLTISFTYITTD